MAAELALPHRLKRQPFQIPRPIPGSEDRLKQVREEATEKAEQQATSSEQQSAVEEKKNDSEAVDPVQAGIPPSQGLPPQPDKSNQASGDKSQANTPITIGQDFATRRLQTPSIR